MNWDNARFFLAIARAGTLRGAALGLGVDQATVGRRLVALEEELSATLFLRTPSLFVLTAAGEALVKPAESMEQSADIIAQRIAGLDDQLAGTLRIATTDSLGLRFVIPALARLRKLHPAIDTVCVASARVANLTRREADVAIRSVRPDAPELITRRLGSLELGLYASSTYLRARGELREGDDFTGHDLVIYQPNGSVSAQDPLCGLPIGRGRVVFRTSSAILQLEAVVNAFGIAEMPVFRAEGDRRLVRVLPHRRGRFDVWLVAHTDLFKTARMQALIALVAEEFEKDRQRVDPAV